MIYKTVGDLIKKLQEFDSNRELQIYVCSEGTYYDDPEISISTNSYEDCVNIEISDY